MAKLPFALYNAFSDATFSGSQGGIVLNAGRIDAADRLRIARELGFPATCFVSDYDDKSVTARFQSTEKEYPMCGHGTICLMTQMVELGVFEWNDSDHMEVKLRLPNTSAVVEIHRREDNRAIVMLDINPPTFRQDEVDAAELAGLLGIDATDLAQQLPLETAIADFVHLIVPVNGLAAMGRIAPDFGALSRYCKKNGFETVATFCTEVEQAESTIHVRDFCPAVGVAESAAAGTTNAGLTAYLIRHNVVTEDEKGQIVVQAEQGYEIKRPSSIRSIVSMKDGAILRLQVGGVATKVIDGHFYLPDA